MTQEASDPVEMDPATVLVEQAAHDATGQFCGAMDRAIADGLLTRQQVTRALGNVDWWGDAWHEWCDSESAGFARGPAAFTPYDPEDPQEIDTDVIARLRQDLRAHRQQASDLEAVLRQHDGR